jgi:MFS family permease
VVPYVTSDFSSQSLLNTIYVVGDCMAAATFIPVARAMDTFGRAEGFLAMVIFGTLGLIMMAACHNLPTFCAAYVSSSI